MSAELCNVSLSHLALPCSTLSFGIPAHFHTQHWSMAPSRNRDTGNDRPPWLMAFEAQEELSPLPPVEQLLFLIDPIRASLVSWPARLPRGRGSR